MLLQAPSLQRHRGEAIRGKSRRGFSLLEVLTALAIFLLSLIGIGQLLSQSGERALETQQLGLASLLCQAKMAEVIAGAVPLTSHGDTACDEDSNYQWSMDRDATSIANLWNVKVRISRARADGPHVICTLNQMVLDPAQRGSAADTPASASGSTAPSSGATPGSTGSSLSGN